MRVRVRLGAIALATAAAFGLTAVAQEAAPGPEPSAPAAQAEALTPPARPPTAFGAWGFDLDGRDLSIRPGDDFNGHANGTFLAKLQIPPDRAAYGVGYAVDAAAEEQVRAILEDPARSEETAKTRAFYAAFMDEAKIEALGLSPLAAELAAARAAASREDIARLMATSPFAFHSSLFDVYIDADPKTPERYSVGLAQSGLGLPDRDYYLEGGFAEEKAAYERYVAQMLRLAGWDDPDTAARAIMAFETATALASWPRADRRDVERTYNPMSVAQLERFAPGFPWRLFLANARLGRVNQVVVNERSAFPRMAAIFAATPVETLRAWAAFHLVDNASPYLSSAFVDARFEFRARTLAGQEEQRARWKRGVAAVNGAMGEAVGKEYVERHFPPEAKAKVDALVGDLRAAMQARIERLDWMSAPTKAEALKKLAALRVKIAYPDRWRDYGPLVVLPDDLAGNVARAASFEWAREVDRLDQPVDRDEWEMTPQTVNAYFNPPMNEIVFPAAILQAPYFDADADPAVNYGAIGAIIGHEITHGFDDEGRKTDFEGRLRNWWTPQDARRFEAEAAKLARQYSAYEPLPGARINGELTLGENIADLGGLLVALDAYRLSLQGRPAPVIDGLTGDQRFFLAYAQSWREKRREAALRQQLVADPHAPEAFRINGVVRNVDAWYAAFGVEPGGRLHLPPSERVRIW